MVCEPFKFNGFQPALRLITASFADQHNTTSLNGFKARLPDYEPCRAAVEDMNIHPRYLDVTMMTARGSSTGLEKRTE